MRLPWSRRSSSLREAEISSSLPPAELPRNEYLSGRFVLLVAFFAGRLFGEGILRRWPFSRAVSRGSLERSEAWFRYIEGAASTEEWVEHQLNFMDQHLLAEDLRSYGRDIIVISPESLAAAVRDGFAKVASTHA